MVEQMAGWIAWVGVECAWYTFEFKSVIRNFLVLDGGVGLV